MAFKTELTSEDLSEIRQSALGAADPLGIAADLADAAEAGRLADKDDAGYALALAAEIAESRTKLDAALRYVERAVEAYGERDDSQAGGAKALRARILFRLGRADEAMASLEPLRPLLTQYPDAAAYITAALGAGQEHRLAEKWLTEAVQDALAASGSTTEPSSAEDAGVLFFLLQQRHRLRHALGLQHDTHDNLAERLETRLANAGAASNDQVDLLFFRQPEFDRLLSELPALTSAFGADWDEHRAILERELVRLTNTGRTGLTVLPATVVGLTGFAGADGDVADARTRSGYAQQLAGREGQIPWPPERNAACWCGSGNKYKKCCLPRSR
ncbi:SEC-C metal-binding domain-containing protein [Paractinoplanes brasiliensis]|uniref:SEC-C motif-containing protein n=1 Tax=Paractinoplanes brasiliensis TaxID=52695 RepID=A0A4R6JBZ8_9ACTN|nr:SEC-C metal-binding domain-containing protein [Actinoplanes brasiliensis]TDO32451.1 SEC-C motif-containing protein [Actinoplanes brasiliensis]GID27677.1 preprotein translocase SecA [Actinoplanes brasiliensis]